MHRMNQSVSKLKLPRATKNSLFIDMLILYINLAFNNKMHHVKTGTGVMAALFT